MSKDKHIPENWRMAKFGKMAKPIAKRVERESERDQWMLCMNKAIAEIPMNPRLETNLKNALQELATHMINQMPGTK